MTWLTASILVNDFASLPGLGDRAWSQGADALELRLDRYRNDSVKLAEWINSQPNQRFILTCRSRKEGGFSDDDALTRAKRLAEIAVITQAAVDFEWVDWRDHPEVKESLSAAIGNLGEPRTVGSRLILSRHDQNGTPSDPHVVVQEIRRETSTAIGKIAYRANHINDSFAALDVLHDFGSGVIAVAMGPDGLWTRLLAGKLGAFATFAALTDETKTAEGQLTLSEMIEIFRWREIRPNTKVYGVIGDPVAHSMSPSLFNHWFSQARLDAVYLPLLTRRKGNCVRRFLDQCRERPWLDIGGLSVTVPHKTAALHWAGETADRAARNIGALNTLSFRAGAVCGHNTDCHTGTASLARALDCRPTDLLNLTVDLLGTGGAARALLYGLSMLGCRITVYGRSPDRTKRLADAFGAAPASWDDRQNRRGEIVINTTSVGMWPDIHESPLSTEALGSCRLVFDLIYNPLETQLLRDAKNAGVPTLNGLDMFVRQAAMQFALWTQTEPPSSNVDEMLAREIVRRHALSPPSSVPGNE